MSKHFLFIDDSGSKDWETPYSDNFKNSPPIRNGVNLNFWRRNYFVLAGIYISLEDIKKINPEINKSKIKYFGTKHVEIKSDWLRNPDRRKKHYIEPFGINEKSLKDFVENEWYGIFESNKDSLQIQAFILDKRCFKNKRAKNTPLQILIQVLFDRVELNPHKDCEIVFDQMDTEIKSISHNQGQILKISSKEIDLGSFQKKYSHTKPRFEKSKNSNLLQLADTAAYDVYRQFIEQGELKSKIYPYLERILPNFYGVDGRISGLGIIKVPKQGH